MKNNFLIKDCPMLIGVLESGLDIQGSVKFSYAVNKNLRVLKTVSEQHNNALREQYFSLMKNHKMDPKKIDPYKIKESYSKEYQVAYDKLINKHATSKDEKGKEVVNKVNDKVTILEANFGIFNEDLEKLDKKVDAKFKKDEPVVYAFLDEHQKFGDAFSVKPLSVNIHKLKDIEELPSTFTARMLNDFDFMIEIK